MKTPPCQNVYGVCDQAVPCVTECATRKAATKWVAITLLGLVAFGWAVVKIPVVP